MCTQCEDPRIHRPAVSDDVNDLKKFYPEVGPDLIDEIFLALTDWNVVTPVVPAVIVEMVCRYQLGDKGSFERPTLPFSAMALKTGERFQTPEMIQCHHMFESLTLAQRNVGLVQEALKKSGMQLVFFCDCGCSIEASEVDPYTEEYLRVNAYRSYWEAVGAPVIQCESFDSDEWKNQRLDMGHSENESYRKIGRFLSELPRRNSKMPDSASQGLDLLKDRFPCGCKDPSCGSNVSSPEKAALA